MRAVRQRGKGGFGILLAALMLFARLLGPAAAMPPEPIELALQTICHADVTGGAPAQPAHPDHQSCLLCPACHLASLAALPVPPSPALPVSLGAALGIAEFVPPATGPPARQRSTAQPTGPPSVSA